MKPIYASVTAFALGASGLFAGCASIEERREIEATRATEECIYLLSFSIYVRLIERVENRLPTKTAEITDLHPSIRHFKYFDPSSSWIEYFVGTEPESFRIVLFTPNGQRETNEKEQCIPEPS